MTDLIFYHSPSSIFSQIRNVKVIYLINLNKPQFYVVDKNNCQYITSYYVLKYTKDLTLTMGEGVIHNVETIRMQVANMISQGYIGMSGDNFLQVCPINSMELLDKINFLKQSIKEQKPGFFTKLKHLF